MEKFKYYIVRSLKLLCFSLLFVSCKDEISTGDVPDQLFRPVVFNAVINGSIVSLSWQPIANASYALEFSRDSFLFKNEVQVFSLDSVSNTIIGDLWSNSRYSARIKAISKDLKIKNSEYNQITFVTGTENIFNAVLTADIGSNSVLLKWDSAKKVTSIVVTTTGVADITNTLSAADILSGQKLIAGLSAGVSYAFKIYNGEMLRGTITVKTKV